MWGSSVLFPKSTDGLASSHSLFASQSVMSSGVFYRWGFYAPDGPALDEVRELVEAGEVSAPLCCRSGQTDPFVLTK